MLESDEDVPAVEQPVMVRAVPATSPVMAAERISVLAVRFMFIVLHLWYIMFVVY
jgi:hypothetical protein